MALINRNQRLNGLNPLSYVGVDSYQPPEFVTDNRAPTASDARNFYLGTLWLDISGYPVTLPTAENIWMLVALVGNQATWVHFGSGGIMTLTGNTGGPVSPDGAFNINVVGDTTTINIADNPGTNTLTVSTVGTGVVSSLTGDSGGAVFPTAGNINLLGTAGKITTTGTPGTHQIVWNLDGSVAQSFPTDAGTATPAANALTIKANVAAQGSGSSVEFTGSGSTVLLNVTDANNNTIIGKSSGNATLTSTNCTVLGEGSFSAATSSSNSVIIGQGAANAITSGGGHVIIGQGAGSALSGTETNNVLINSSGVAGKIFIKYI